MAEQHLQHLMKLIEAKQVYTSYALLKKMPADTHIPGKQKIINELKNTLAKGTAIHAILQNNRNNGDYPTALQQGLKLQEIIPDYPNLKHDMIAIRETLKTLEATISKAKIAASHGRTNEVITLLQTVRQIDAKHKEIGIIEKTVRRKSQGKSVKSIIISSLIIILPCILFGTEKIMIWQAQDNLNAASTLISSNQFNQASKSINKMHKALRLVHVFNRSKKQNLVDRATSLQSSMTFAQGMLGKVIHDGEFIQIEKKNLMTSLRNQIAEAEILIQDKQWQEALNKYDAALEFVTQHEGHIGAEQQTIREKIAALENTQTREAQQLKTNDCLAIITLAQAAFTAQNWQQAAEKYTEAFEFAGHHNIRETCIDPQSSAQYNTTVITILLAKGDTLKSQDNPAEAVDFYLQAIDHATIETMDQTTITEIQSHIDNLQDQVFLARVRRLIREGDEFIIQKEFTDGLSKYNFGVTMLESNTEPLQAKNKLIEILTQKITQTETTAAITRHTTELNTSAEAYLRKYFNIISQDKLAELSIILIEQKENLYTYRISAKSIREKMKYELLYQINENTGVWKIVN